MTDLELVTKLRFGVVCRVPYSYYEDNTLVIDRVLTENLMRDAANRIDKLNDAIRSIAVTVAHVVK